MSRSIDTMITDLSAGGRRLYAAMTELVEQGETAITALVVGAGVLLLVARNLYLTLKSWQPIQQPLT